MLAGRVSSYYLTRLVSDLPTAEYIKIISFIINFHGCLSGGTARSLYKAICGHENGKRYAIFLKKYSEILSKLTLSDE